MGANCCVAAREKPMPDRISHELSGYRSVGYSPSWSFRWDNRTHIEDIMDNPSRFSHHYSGNIGSVDKSAADTEIEGLSDGGSPYGSLQTRKWRRKVGVSGISKSASADESTGSKLSHEERSSIKSSVVASASDSSPSISIPSSSSFKASEPSTSKSCSLQPDPSSPRKARRFPGFQLSRQISDSRLPFLNSLDDSSNCSPECRHSLVLSASSNDLSAGESHGSSSDSWSMRTFTELVAASSQRERWSVESASLGAVMSKISGSSPPTSNSQICGVCSKLLKEKSPSGAQKIVMTNELSIAAVLVCGHIYHADCMENITSENDRYDPPCPVCTSGNKITPKELSEAEPKARSKISKRAVADIDVDVSKNPRMGSSSSMKESVGRPPFLRRHFSFGSRPSPSLSMPATDSTRKKKGFWSRRSRD